MTISMALPASGIAPIKAQAEEAAGTVVLTPADTNGASARVSDGVSAGVVDTVSAGGGPVSYGESATFDKIRMYSSYDNQEYIFPIYYSDGLFYGNPQEYNPHLGTASWAFAVASSYLNKDEEATEDGNVYYNKHAAGRQFLADIGCPDDRIYVNSYNTTIPTADSIGVIIGSKDLTYAGGTKTGDTLVAIAVRGINYDMEWESNVTLGLSGEAEGFSRAATTVYNEIRDYLTRYRLMDAYKNGRVKFWITGFSRAGATANLTAKRLVEMIAEECTGNYESELFAYTCEAPRGGVDAAEQLTDKTEYFCIHNMVNKADIVPLVGPEQMGFKRYGVDHYIPGTTFENYDGGMLPYDYNDSQRLPIQTGYYQVRQFQREAKKAASEDRTVTSYADNLYVSTKTQRYNEQRTKMLEHLSALDPTFSFDDTFKPYAMDFFLSVKIYEKGYDDWRNTEETFIEDFLNFAQVGYRGKWESKSFDPDYVVVPSREYYVRNGVQDLAQFYMRMAYGPDGFALDVNMDSFNSLPIFPLFVTGNPIVDLMLGAASPSLVKLYVQCVRGWDELSDSKKQGWADTFWDMMEKDGAFAELTDPQKAGLRVRWDDLVDRAFTFVNSDYQAASPFCGALSPGYKPYTYSYTAYDASDNSLEEKQANWRDGFDDESMMYLPTFMENADYIMTCHDKVLNMAWVRSYDSWYDGETTHYKLERPSAVSAPTAYAIDEKTGKRTELVPGEDANVFTSAQRVYFEGDDAVGEAIYYSYDGTDGSKSQTLFDGNSIDLRPSSVDVPEKSWTLSTFAMSYGVRSEELTYNISLYNDTHVVSVLGPYDERTITAKEGEQVTISLPDDVAGTAYFSTWKVENYIDHSGGDWELVGDATEGLGISVNGSGTKLSFTMPKSGSDSFPYAYRLRLLYDYKQAIDEVSIDIPKPVEGGTLAENATVTFPDGTVAEYPIGWTYINPYHPEGTFDWVENVELAHATGGDEVYQETEYRAEVKIPKDAANGIVFAEYVKAPLTGGGVYDHYGYYMTEESKLTTEAMLERISWDGSLIARVEFEATGTTAGNAKPSTRFGLEVVPIDLNVEEQDGESTTYLVEQGKSITVTAPAVEKEQFLYWESDDVDIPEASKYDQTTTLTIPEGLPVGAKLTVRACYVPMITELNAQIQAPVAGEALPTTTGTLGVTVLNGYELDPAFVEVSWLPAASDDEEQPRVAKHLTQYTAAIKLTPKEDENGPYIMVKQVADAEGNPVVGSDFERQNALFVYSDNLQVASSAESDEASARIVETTCDTATNTVYVTFASQNYELASVLAPSPVFGVPYGTTAEEIQAMLPQTTVIWTANGLMMDAAITWAAPAPGSFDDAREAIMWTARGSVILPDGIDNPDSDSREIPVMDTVYVDAADTAVPPSASVPSGMFVADQVVTLSSSEDGGTTYYTVDGSDPTPESPVYTGEEILVSKDAEHLEDEMTYQEFDGEVDDEEDAKTGEWIPTGRKMFVIKAYTVVDGKWDSPVATYAYVIDNKVSVPEGAELTYSGSAQVGVPASEFYTVESVSGSGAVDEDGNAVATDAGTYQAVLKVADGFVWQLPTTQEGDPETTADDQTVEFTIVPASLATAKVEVLEDPAALVDGKAEPAVRVTLDGAEVPETGYTVAYGDNTTTGTATVTVTGQGNYTGTASGTFQVSGSDIAGMQVTVAAQTYTGKALKPNPTKVTLGGKTLALGVDYKVKGYKNNVNAGTASITIEGIGLYAGTATGTFKINPAKLTADMVTVAAQTYAGKALKPAPVVEFSGKTLKSGADYTVGAYANNVNAGNATVTVTGKGNFTGSVKKSFEISPAKVTDAVLSATTLTYSGKAQRPAVKRAKAGSLTLSTDDYTVKYSVASPKDVGTYKVTVTGRGDFTGSVAKTFKIAPASIKGGTLTCKWQAYTGKAVTPTKDVKLVVGGRTLKYGTDFTVASYKRNVKPGYGTFVVTGKGNYSGTLAGEFVVRFKDVPPSHEYFEDVHRAASLGIVHGYSGSRLGDFGPEDSLTRGQVATMLWNMTGQPAPKTGGKRFSDVPDGKYYTEAVAWAVSVGVVNGYSGARAGQFGPNDPVTHEQLCVMICNYAKNVGKVKAAGSASAYAKLPDAGKVSSWARPSVGWCFQQKITTGFKGKVNPQGFATRAETASMVYQLYLLLNK